MLQCLTHNRFCGVSAVATYTLKEISLQSMHDRLLVYVWFRHVQIHCINIATNTYSFEQL